MNVLKLNISGRYGHYGRPEGSVVNQTYRIPPKTALKGMFAAILGLERDSYYGDMSNFKVSVVPDNIRTETMGILTLSTDSHIKTVNGLSTVTPDKTKKNRQLTPYEFLVNPSYTIYVTVDDPYYSHLQEFLSEGKSVYTPTLGLSECLASIDYKGEIKLDETDVPEVDSAVPENAGDKIQADGSLSYERMASGFELDGNGRYPSGFINVVVPEDAEHIIFNPNEDTTIYSDGNTNILFY